MARSSTLRIEVLADARKATAELDRTSGKLARFGKLAAAGAAAGAAAVGAVALASVQSASRVQQSFGAIDSVFGASAAAVKKSAGSAARDLGLASSEYAELAAVLGSQLKNTGTAAKDLAPATDRLIKQGADLAATFGGSTADAVAAVSSLLKGERDPIERYGVSIKAADVSARLAAQGLSGLTGKAKAQAEATATLALLSEQTAAAQGANAREAGTLAGVQARLGATVEDLKVKLGAGLLPVLSSLGTFLLERVLPAAAKLGGELRTRLGPTFAAVGAFITQKVVPAAQQFISWYVEKIVPGIRRTVTPVVQGIRSAFGNLARSVDDNRPALEKLQRAVKPLVEFLANKVAPVVGTVVGGAWTALGRAIGVVVDIIGGAINAVDKIVRKLGDLKDALTDNVVTSNLGKLGGLFSSHTVTPEQLAAARSGGPGLLLAAGGVPARPGLASRLSLSTGDVHVYVDGAPVRAVVRRELAGWEGRAARRLATSGGLI